MKVRTFYRPGAVYTAPAETIRDAARKMRFSALSCLPVVDAGAVVGIVTERDLVEAVANGVQPGVAQVADYTNDGSAAVSLDDDGSVAQVKMLAIGCRHLPVLDGGSLVGMVSLRDLFLAEARETLMPDAAELVAAAVAPAQDWPEEPPPDVDSEG